MVKENEREEGLDDVVTQSTENMTSAGGQSEETFPLLPEIRVGPWILESGTPEKKTKDNKIWEAFGRTKRGPGGLGDLSSLRRPVARRLHRSRRRQCLPPPAVSETQKGHEETAACLNGLPVFVRTPIRSNIQLCGHSYCR